MVKKRLSIKEIFSSVRKQSISMRRRFALCLIACLISVIAILLLLFSLFDITNSADNDLDHILTQQLDHSSNQIYRDMDQLAALAVEFSKQVGEQIEEFDTPFEKLKNNVSALTDLQKKTYETVRNNMRIADCSGAFYILNTTVNDQLKDTYYSGIYLRYANVGSSITLRNSICMFRGASQVARQNSINLFSTWECETKKGTFPQMEVVLDQLEADPTKGYLLTKAYKLPEAWEKVRLLCAPISDKSGTIIGVCGFEISDPFFYSAYQASDAEQEFMVCALIEQENGTYTGQLAPNHSGYAPDLKGAVTIDNRDRFSAFIDDNMTLIGKTNNIKIGSSDHTVAVMIPEKQYDMHINKELTKTIILLVIVSILSVVASILLSHRYIRPLLRSVEQIKAKQFEAGTHIPEFTDLFEFLAEQDRINENELSRARNEKADALAAASEIQKKFDETAKQNERLAYSRKDEIDPYDYENFKIGLKMLTEKERQVFDFYMQGKTVKEIIATLGLQESTVRFHNKNIYAKLGVHSLKQLLRYAAILKQEDDSAI